MRLLFEPTKPAVRRAKRHQSSSDSETINIGTPKTSEGSEREKGQEEAALKRRATRYSSEHEHFVNVTAMIRTDYGQDLRIWR